MVNEHAQTDEAATARSSAALAALHSHITAQFRQTQPRRHVLTSVRRRVAGLGTPAYYVCFAPVDTPLASPVQVAGRRWPIDTRFVSAKGEAGFDQCQVQSGRAGIGTQPCASPSGLGSRVAAVLMCLQASGCALRNGSS